MIEFRGKAIVRRTLSTLALLLASTLPSTSMLAQTVTPNPDPGITGEGFVDFTGRFGEVFKLRGGRIIKSYMKDDAEIIDFHTDYDPTAADGVLTEFAPAPSFFIPKNFTPYYLVRLSIQPFRGQSLAKMKADRVAQLNAEGAHFKVYENPHYSGFEADAWPAGSFEIFIDKPYRLNELYTASPSYFCVLTHGVDVPPSTVNGSYSVWVRSGLGKWITTQSPKSSAPGGYQPAWITPEMTARAFFSSPGFLLLLGIVFSCLLLSCIPSSWAFVGRISWAARFALVGATAAFVLGATAGIGLAELPVRGPVHSIEFVVVLASALLGAGGFLVSRRAHLKHLRTPSLAVVAVCVLHLLTSLPGLAVLGEESTASGLRLQSGFASSVVGILAGIAFGLFFRPPLMPPKT